MKAIITFGILLISMVSSQAFGQMTAYANIYAEVVAPAYIEKSADMTFSRISPSANSGSVVLSGTGDLQGAATLQAGKGTLATFTIQGNDISTFDISLPNREVVISGSNSGSVKISDFTTSVTASASSQGNRRVVSIGATLHIDENQSTGNFNDSKSFQVNFNYN